MTMQNFFRKVLQSVADLLQFFGIRAELLTLSRDDLLGNACDEVCVDVRKNEAER